MIGFLIVTICCINHVADSMALNSAAVKDDRWDNQRDCFAFKNGTTNTDAKTCS